MVSFVTWSYKYFWCIIDTWKHGCRENKMRISSNSSEHNSSRVLNRNHCIDRRMGRIRCRNRCWRRKSMLDRRKWPSVVTLSWNIKSFAPTLYQLSLTLLWKIELHGDVTLELDQISWSVQHKIRHDVLCSILMPCKWRRTCDKEKLSLGWRTNMLHNHYYSSLFHHPWQKSPLEGTCTMGPGHSNSFRLFHQHKVHPYSSTKMERGSLQRRQSHP